MALVVFLRGINVGGHRAFRPSILAQELSDYDVVNVGATGTFVVRKPASRARFRAELLKRLPFEAHVALCEGRDLIRLERENPFAAEPARPDVVRFVSILVKTGRVRPSIPITLPPDAELEHHLGDRADFERPGEEGPLTLRLLSSTPDLDASVSRRASRAPDRRARRATPAPRSRAASSAWPSRARWRVWAHRWAPRPPEAPAASVRPPRKVPTPAPHRRRP